MNKYREALFRMSKVEDVDTNKFDNDYSVDDYIEDGLVIFELMDKATPMKPKLVGKDNVCGNCEVMVVVFNGYRLSYCPNCGQKLDWE